MKIPPKKNEIFAKNQKNHFEFFQKLLPTLEKSCDRGLI